MRFGHYWCSKRLQTCANSPVKTHSRLRKQLFWQIYIVVLGSLLTLALLLGLAIFLRGPLTNEHKHPPPIFPMLIISALVVGVAAYPVSRRLTYRLEHLKQGVEAFGQGDLQARVPVRGYDEIAQLAQSFNQSAARIQTLVQNHRQLLANASHELRSPLARLRMGLEFLADSNPQTQHTLLALRQDIRELDQLVEEILLASRLDTPEIPLQRQTLDLAGLLAEECARVQVDCLAESLELVGDERLLRRLIRNLLENAKRHGAAPIRAELTRLATTAELNVLDQGAGVPMAERVRLFEPFYRPAGYGEGQGGWGLGLSLVKQIAERHGGTVSYFENPAGGSCFCVCLPLNPLPTAEVTA